MKIDLTDSDGLKSIMSEAILRAVDEKTRDTLIKQAITYLLAPGEPIYQGGKKRPSPLEESYKYAVESYARRMAHELLEQDEGVKAQVKGLLQEAMERAFVTHREATVERVAKALAEGLWSTEVSR